GGSGASQGGEQAARDRTRRGRTELREGRRARSRRRDRRRWQADDGGSRLMTPQGEIFMPDEEVVFRGRPMRVAGRVQFEGSSGQLTFRYLLSDPTGAPVIIEEGEGRFAQLRPFPVASQPRTAKNTVSVGPEKYTLVGVRKLTVLD